jgi:hypothetical protein
MKNPAHKSAGSMPKLERSTQSTSTWQKISAQEGLEGNFQSSPSYEFFLTLARHGRQAFAHCLDHIGD